MVTYPVLKQELYAATVQPTPSNTEGPYYKAGAPFRMNLKEAGDSGTPLTVSGSLVDTSDRPIPGGLIEIWHVGNGGRYDMDGYRYRASVRTSPKGEYRFDTYMPANYGGRPRHVHYKITAEGYENLVTQLYFENDPFFEGKLEKNIGKDPLVGHRELIRPVVPFQETKAVSVNFKICLAGDR